MATPRFSDDAAIYEYSYTSGNSGVYLLAGAWGGCFTFKSEWPAGAASIPIRVTDDSANTEISRALFNAGANTLTVIGSPIISTNGGALVNWSGRTRLLVHALNDELPLCATAPTVGQVLAWDGSEWCPATPNGPGAPLVPPAAAVCATPPVDGQVLIWSDAENAYCPADFCSLVAACMSPSPTCLPFIVYSNRKVVPSYAGALYTIRRSSDHTTMVFSPDMSGDAPAAAINTFLGGSDGTVTLWNDQSGNGYDAVSDIEPEIWGGDPLWLPSEVGGRPALRFLSVLDGINARGLSARSVMFPTANWTMFFVIKHEAYTNYDTYPDQLAIGSLIGINNGAGDSGSSLRVHMVPRPQPGPPLGAVVLARADDDVDVGSNRHSIQAPDDGDEEANFADNYAIVEVAWGTNFSDAVAKDNGSDVTPLINHNIGSADFPVSGDMAIGAFSATTWLNDPLTAFMAEIQIYNCILTSAERTAIRQNIATYYGITIT